MNEAIYEAAKFAATYSRELTVQDFSLHPVDDIDSLVTVADWREDVNWYNRTAEAEEGPEEYDEAETAFFREIDEASCPIERATPEDWAEEFGDEPPY